MIKSFRDKNAEALFGGKVARPYQAFKEQAERRLTILNEAEKLADLRALPSNYFEALGGNRDGQYSIRINKQWRICFRWDLRQPLTEKQDILMAEGDARHVEIDDYH